MKPISAQEVARLLNQGLTRSAIAKKLHVRKTTMLAYIRGLLGEDYRAPPQKFIPQKYKRVLKVFCFRDWLVDDEKGYSYVGVNLYFILYLLENQGYTPLDYDFFGDVQEWFKEELENSAYGASGLRYDFTDLSECDLDDIKTTIPAAKKDQFVFEISQDVTESQAEIQYYGWYQKSWKTIYVYREFDKQGLEWLLRKRF